VGNETTRKLIKTTEAIAKNFGLKFCTQCNLTRPVEGGKVFKITNGRTRWKCATCTARMKPSGFGEKRRKDAVPEVRQQDGMQPDKKLHRP
jgi:hypothetical protein